MTLSVYVRPPFLLLHIRSEHVYAPSFRDPSTSMLSPFGLCWASFFCLRNASFLVYVGPPFGLCWASFWSTGCLFCFLLALFSLISRDEARACVLTEFRVILVILGLLTRKPTRPHKKTQHVVGMRTSCLYIFFIYRMWWACGPQIWVLC
jgi:hypothetical protein